MVVININFRLTMTPTTIDHIVGHFRTPFLFKGGGIGAIPGEDLRSGIQQVGIGLGQTATRDRFLLAACHFFGASNMVQTCGQFRKISFVDFHMTESRINATIQIPDTVVRSKQIEELFRFLSFRFPMLDRQITQQIIEFIGLVGSDTVFILRGFGTNPKVNVIKKGFTVRILVRVQDNVGIAIVKFSITTGRPGIDAKVGSAVFIAFVFDAPNLQAHFRSGTGPIHFQPRRLFTSGLVFVRTNVSQVTFFQGSVHLCCCCRCCCELSFVSSLSPQRAPTVQKRASKPWRHRVAIFAAPFGSFTTVIVAASLTKVPFVIALLLW
mmetsp:Transcript_8/g.11  ORF Transcript_8/g.11 Transcript_8/m.11 type:complete len:324 (-) Transcript_8:17-988(-)